MRCSAWMRSVISSCVATHPPSAIRQRFVHDLDRTSIGGLDRHGLSQPDVAQHAGTVFLDVALERSRGLAVRDNVAEMAAGLYHLDRQTVHFDVAVVADNQPLG